MMEKSQTVPITDFSFETGGTLRVGLKATTSNNTAASRNNLKRNKSVNQINQRFRQVGP